MVPHAPKTPPVDRRNQGDRRRVSRYRFLDRRTAFDRRRRYPVLGSLRDSSWLLLAVLIATNLLSLADGVLTALEIEPASRPRAIRSSPRSTRPARTSL